MNKEKTLYIIATPIGNLNDISFRAIDTLKSSDLILCEDTRRFKILANHYEINNKTASFHEHNENYKTQEVINFLKEFKSVSLVSDAGTPCISDPGYNLIKECYNNNIDVISIPGPSSVIAAMSVSGLPCHSFTFKGFLPQTKGKKEAILRESIDSKTTTIFFESPYRILKTLEIINSINDKTFVFLSRELTKIHEESIRGLVPDVIEILKKKASIKGEFVLILSSKEKL